MRQVAYLDANLAGNGPKQSSVKKLRLKAGESVAGQPLVVIHDISEQGLLIESAQQLATGERLDVFLPALGPRRAMVVWNSGRFFGCEFAEPVPADLVKAALLETSGGSSLSADELSQTAAQLEELSMAVLRIGRVVDRAIDQLSRERRGR